MKDRSTSSSTSRKDKPTHSNSFFGVALFVIVILIFLILYVQKSEEFFDGGNIDSDSDATISTSADGTTASENATSIGLPYSKGPSGPPENLSQPTFLPSDD